MAQALADFDLAEQNRFEDKCALYIARGSVRRLLGHSKLAAEDFKQAYDLLDKQDKVRPKGGRGFAALCTNHYHRVCLREQVGRVRILSFKAFCLIDQEAYRAAYDALIVALEFNREILLDKMSKFTTDMEKVDSIIHSYLKRHGGSWYTKPLSEIEGDILYLKRIDWILEYHCALSIYMLKDFVHAQQVSFNVPCFTFITHGIKTLLTAPLVSFHVVVVGAVPK
jgi:tetratricopeptide (TPR) repeat protein